MQEEYSFDEFALDEEEETEGGDSELFGDEEDESEDDADLDGDTDIEE